MGKVTDSPSIENRKADHIQINLNKDVQFPHLTTGLERYRFMHQALPELDLAEIDTHIELFGRSLDYPDSHFFDDRRDRNGAPPQQNLAQAAQEHHIAMGVGSQRAAMEDPTLAETLQVRNVAPDILLLANLGAVQLNYGYGVEHCQRAVDMIEADALILHFNVLQEAVQPEGDSNFAGLLNKVEAVCRKLPVPVIAKEVGWGFSEQNARDLANAGVAAIDVAGSGGTSWSEVEYHRAPTDLSCSGRGQFRRLGYPDRRCHSVCAGRRARVEHHCQRRPARWDRHRQVHCAGRGHGRYGRAFPESRQRLLRSR